MKFTSGYLHKKDRKIGLFCTFAPHYKLVEIGWWWGAIVVSLP